MIIALCLALLLPNKEVIADYYAHKVAEQYRIYEPYEQSRLVHDYLIQTVRYDEKGGKAYDALVKHRANCQGYSMAFYEIMTHLGVKTNVHIGWAEGLHAWNDVEIDGECYFIDVTYDDKDDGKVYYDWFMTKGIKDHYSWFMLY